VTERPQVHDEAVPALARGVKLRFDKGRDAWVLLAPEKVLMPDQIAIAILQRCDGKAQVTEIVDGLAVAFSADRDQVAGDVRAFLQDLADKGMITL
jgi:pyrroloquinoline quinone biosynthesis protein D